jgi:hypothetical protein
MKESTHSSTEYQEVYEVHLRETSGPALFLDYTNHKAVTPFTNHFSFTLLLLQFSSDVDSATCRAVRVIGASSFRATSLEKKNLAVSN